MKIKPVYHDVGILNAHEIISRELPFVDALYNEQGQLHRDTSEWLEFFIKNSGHLPMYAIDEGTAHEIAGSLTDYYAMMKEALARLFLEPIESVKHWFDCSAARKPAFEVFYAYAKAVYEADNLLGNLDSHAIYGRFDAAVDPHSGQVTGVYEFNGDTPVMLFESINLQNLISQALGRPEDQFNQWWEKSLETLKAYGKYAGKTVAVVCDVRYIEDSTTCETISQLFDAVGASAYLTTLESLNHDVMSLDRPFTIDGVDGPADAVFMLLPWEEMLVSGHDVLLHWRSWHMNVRFLEPAWRWFMSHKGMLAYISMLRDKDEDFQARWADLPHLRTELSPESFIARGVDYVAKPVIGRLSQNIAIYRAGQTPEVTDGQYGAEPMVYQEFHAPYQVLGRNNFILGGWIAAGEVATLCIREFDGAVLDLQNERFIAHCLTNN